MENSVDPDQLAQKPADLDLHCFRKQNILRFSMIMVKMKHQDLVIDKSLDKIA